MEIIRIFHAKTQKLSPIYTSLHSKSSFLLLSFEKKELIVWVGLECSRVDRAIAENLGSEIVRDQFKQSIASNHIPVYLENNENIHPFILTFFQTSFDNIQLHLKTTHSSSSSSSSLLIDSNITSNSIENDDIYLTCIDIDIHNGEILSSSTSKHILIHNASKLVVSEFSSHKVYCYECGTYERYLWIGHHIPRKFHNNIIQSLQTESYSPLIDLSSPLVVLRDGFETILFLEKFHNIFETFPNNKTLKHSHDISMHEKVYIHKKNISSEVSRMISTGFGTLSMITHGLGQDSSTGLKMDFLDDSSSQITLWKISNSTRLFTLINENERGLFYTHECYALLYRYSFFKIYLLIYFTYKLLYFIIFLIVVF